MLFALKMFFVGLWPIAWHLGACTLTIAALLAFVFLTPAWLLPRLKKIALWAAATLAIGMMVAIRFDKIGADRVHAQWDWTLEQEAIDGEQIHTDAERAVRAEPPDSVRNDPWNRNRGKQHKEH